MTISHATPKNRSKLAAVSPAPDPAIDLNNEPVNIINDRLGKAHATLDLLFTIATSDDAHSLIESFCQDTLINALDSAMYCISDAMEAAERIPANAVKGVAHG